MIENKIYKVNSTAMAKIIQSISINVNTHLVEIHGENIQSWNDYISEIECTFKLPTTFANTIDGYNDWMTDLDWLEKDGYALIIYNYKEFLTQDLPLKKIIIDGFENHILPFWQEEVEKCVVEGKAKPFNVYLVE